MNKNNWILLFFIVLTAHITGIQMAGSFTDVQRRGGRNFKVRLPVSTDKSGLQRDLRKEFSGETPDIEFDEASSTLDFTTTYRIDEPGLETDSLVLAKLMQGLKNYLPKGTTYRGFDIQYKLESKKLLPSAPAREPTWHSRVLHPILLLVCKALLIPLLLGFFLARLKGVSSPLKKWIVAALLFSWAGDVLLMFVPKHDMFFLMGLLSFLLAHIFYIIYFRKIKTIGGIKSRPLLLVIVVVYYVMLIMVLLPYLAEMKIPVLVYGMVISCMFLLALHMVFIRNRPAGQYMMIGALLFVLSDSILAINKFYQPFEWAGFAIMVTYGLAQFFIVKGATSYIISKY